MSFQATAATLALALSLPGAQGSASELARARAACERATEELARDMLAELERRAREEALGDGPEEARRVRVARVEEERDALVARGEWPSSLRRGEWSRRWKRARAELASAYSSEVARAEGRGDGELAAALALDAQRDAACAALAPWRDASALVGAEGAPPPWIRVGEAFLGAFVERSGEDHPALVARGPTERGDGGFALELVLSRLQGQGGLELTLAAPDGGALSCRLPAERLAAAEGARVHGVEGLRLVALVRPGSLRLDLEGETVARADAGEGGPGAAPLLELRPDRDVQLKLALRSKPLTRAEEERPRTRAEAREPEPAPPPAARARRERIRDEDDALRAALGWLAAHQGEDGGWDCDGFAAACAGEEGPACDGPGEPTHDVGVSGLALLAFLRAGVLPGEGEHGAVVERGLAFLCASQEEPSGLLGTMLGHTFMYDHAVATLALCEGLARTREAALAPVAEKAARFLERARTPDAGWRYDVPPLGESDTSLTGWALAALVAAEQAGIAVDPQARAGALRFLDAMTDPESGRVGYSGRGGPSARIPNVNEQFPVEHGEAMTAVGLLARLALGQGLDQRGILAKHAGLLLARPPRWDAEERTIDMYYWFHATLALRRMGEPYWGKWRKALQKTLLAGQVRDPRRCAFGSWDPLGPWGFSGGRVYATALCCMALSADAWADGKPR